MAEQELCDDAALFDDLLDDSPAQPITGRRKKNKKKRRVKSIAMPDYIRDCPEMKKYWAQRYRIFSKFDSGVMLDKGNGYELLNHGDTITVNVQHLASARAL